MEKKTTIIVVFVIFFFVLLAAGGCQIEINLSGEEEDYENVDWTEESDGLNSLCLEDYRDELLEITGDRLDPENIISDFKEYGMEKITGEAYSDEEYTWDGASAKLDIISSHRFKFSCEEGVDNSKLYYAVLDYGEDYEDVKVKEANVRHLKEIDKDSN